jgi:hypothetical protein
VTPVSAPENVTVATPELLTVQRGDPEPLPVRAVRMTGLSRPCPRIADVVKPGSKGRDVDRAAGPLLIVEQERR